MKVWEDIRETLDPQHSVELTSIASCDSLCNLAIEELENEYEHLGAGISPELVAGPSLAKGTLTLFLSASPNRCGSFSLTHFLC